MISRNSFIIAIVTVFCLCCSRDNFTPTVIDCDEQFTYENQIKPIIDSSCSYSGCHDAGSGIGPLNYTIYEGMLPHLTNGSFRDRVILQKDDIIKGMPPDTVTWPQSIKTELSDEELDMIACWLEGGFPKN